MVNKPKKGGRVLTPRQTAKYLGVGENLVYRALGNGQIPHFRLVNRYLISKDVIARMLDGGITISA